MKLPLLLLLLCGVGVGQTTLPSGAPMAEPKLSDLHSEKSCILPDFSGWHVSSLTVNYDDCTITGSKPITGTLIVDPRPDDPWPKNFSPCIGLECAKVTAPRPEAVDVPAIKHEDTRIFYCGQGAPRCDHGEHFDPPNKPLTICSGDEALMRSCGVTKWICADKSRILLTAEDGKKWCHKVEPETRP